MSPNATTVLYVTVCVALFYTCFCRLVRMDGNTHTSVRLAFCLLLTVCLVCVGLTLYSTYKPEWQDLLLPTAMLLVQALTARYWKDGVPSHFQRCVCDPHPSERT